MESQLNLYYIQYTVNLRYTITGAPTVIIYLLLMS